MKTTVMKNWGIPRLLQFLLIAMFCGWCLISGGRV